MEWVNVLNCTGPLGAVAKIECEGVLLWEDSGIDPPPAPVVQRVLPDDTTTYPQTITGAFLDPAWAGNGSCNTGSGYYPYSTGTNKLTQFFRVEPNTSYTFKCDTTGDRFGVYEYWTEVDPTTATTTNTITPDATIKAGGSTVYTSYAFTTSASAKIVAIYAALNTRPVNMRVEDGYEKYAAYKNGKYGYYNPTTSAFLEVSGMTGTIIE